jgi:hypothetical protein
LTAALRTVMIAFESRETVAVATAAIVSDVLVMTVDNEGMVTLAHTQTPFSVMDRTRAPVAAVKGVCESLVTQVRKALVREFEALVTLAYEAAVGVKLVERAMAGHEAILKLAFVGVARPAFAEVEKAGTEGVVMADTAGAEMAVFEAVETAALVDLGIPVHAALRRAEREAAQLVAVAVARIRLTTRHQRYLSTSLMSTRGAVMADGHPERTVSQVVN